MVGAHLMDSPENCDAVNLYMCSVCVYYLINKTWVFTIKKKKAPVPQKGSQ
jgi:hypothetical protein